MDLDELFGEGARLGKDVVVKAQLRFRVHPPNHPVAQDLVDRIVASYDERLDLICREVEDIVQHADLRRSESQPLVLMQKAVQQPYRPGSKGGKWYRDGAGHIRYGEQPQQQFKQKAQPHELAPHIDHYRPGPFRGRYDADRDMVDYLMRDNNGSRLGFTGGELRFLGAWYGTPTKGGSLFDAFLDCAGITRADLNEGAIHLRFGAQKLTYEEAVFEFFAAQSELFLGKEATGQNQVGEWHDMLNDEIKPLLDSVFKKYEDLKSNDEFVASYEGETGKQLDRFLANARRHAKDTGDLANRVLGEWNPSKMIADVIAGMRKLGLFAKQTHVSAKAKHLNQPQLQGSVMLDDRLFTEETSRSPIVTAGEKLSRLTASQLMLLFAAAELHRRWDPETQSYSDEDQEDIGPGHVGEVILESLARKHERWAHAIDLAHKHLVELVDRLVIALNEMSGGV